MHEAQNRGVTPDGASPYVGRPQARVDGRDKVTGAARYAGEFAADDLAHGCAVSASIGRGRIRAIDTAEAAAAPGVIAVYTHANRPRVPGGPAAYHDGVAPPGEAFRPLDGDRILFAGQPVALVVAQSFEAARHAARLVRVEYEAEATATDLAAELDAAYVPPEPRDGIPPPPAPRGDAPGAFRSAPVRVERRYAVPMEHHNPMEPHATTAIFGADGVLTVHDKTQGVGNTRDYLRAVFGLDEARLRVVSPFVGGAFGLALRPQYQAFLAVMAALDLRRSVRVVLTRPQMFSMGFRPATIQDVRLGADADGRLLSVEHAAVAGTSRFEDYQEAVVNWSGLLYRCDNVRLDYRLAKLDTYTPADMRAPGAALGLFALEQAMDELAGRVGVDPVELRLRNYAEMDANAGKPFTSKALREAYAAGAARFGWAARNPAPRSMREGDTLIGWGMAGGVWDAMMMPTAARAVLRADGTAEVATASADIGTGTYTILAQIAADALAVDIACVAVRLGDTLLPDSPVEGGSWTAASAGAAVDAACRAVRARLFGLARRMDGSPVANLPDARLVLRDGRIARADDPAQSVAVADVLRGAGMEEIAAEESVERDASVAESHTHCTHSAVFAEVRVDARLGTVRVARVVSAIAAGRILNPRTARSQIIGGVVFGIGMALTEATVADHRHGRIVNASLADYHVPVHADIGDIDVLFVDEPDALTSPLGVKGVGEIGVVGTAAAIANAVHHATGARIATLPITLDKLLPHLH